MPHDLEQNKKNAIAFYRTAYLGEPKKAVELYVGAEYIQHNPLVGNGKQPFIDYFNEMHRDYPKKSIEFVRAVAEDELVALHTHQTWPGVRDQREPQASAQRGGSEDFSGATSPEIREGASAPSQGTEEYVTMDFFRFDDDGKIVEHWDAMQEIPKETKNGNTMY